jgi:hypothetical protein
MLAGPILKTSRGTLTSRHPSYGACGVIPV